MTQRKYGITPEQAAQLASAKQSIVKDYELAIGPNGNLYICVKGKPHLAYSIDAFRALIAEGKIVAG